MSQEIYLVSKNTDLASHFESQIGNNGTELKILQTTKSVKSKDLPACPIFVIDSEGSLEEALKTIKKRGKAGKEFYAVISGSTALKKTASQIHEVPVHLNGHAKTATPKKEDNGPDLHLSQLLEKKFGEFMKKMKQGHPKNLYDLLLTEFEKPLFNLALQETNGSQIHTAKFLGINRNTLRKKIKELKITIKKNKPA